MEEMHHYYDELPTSSTRSHLPEGWPPRGRQIGRYREMTRKLRLTKWLEWMRWGVVVALQGLIVGLLLWRRAHAWTPKDVETGGDINGIYIPRMCSMLKDSLDVIRGWKR